MTVCMVGGSGFIGTMISGRLGALGVPFVIVDRKDSPRYSERVVTADIRDASELQRAIRGSNIIMHLAAVHRDDVRPVSLYDDVNVEGTRNLCAVAVEEGIDSIVFASSVAVYGFAEINTDETGRIAPFNDYGRTKAEAEAVLLRWQAGDPSRRSLTIIRPTVVFGPGNRGNVFNLFNQIARKHFVMIGDGQNHKSLAYVENVADFFIHFLKGSPGVRIYNYADSPDLNMNELVSFVRWKLFGSEDVGLRLPVSVGYMLGGAADTIARISGRRLPLSKQRVRKFVSNTSFVTAHADTHGFVPRFDLREAIAITLDAEFIHPDPERPIFMTE